MPKISVCMPTYNGSDYLRSAIDSVLAQSYSDFELIIVDDMSKDNTVEIVESYCDSRIRFYKNETNQGLVGNWEQCLANATGDYIHFLFQDDFMYPSCLEKKMNLMERNSSSSLCFSASYVIDKNDVITLKRRPLRGNRVMDGISFARKSFHRHNLYGEPSNVMFRKSAADKVGSFNNMLAYTPDWEYWLRLSTVGSVCYVDDYLACFRVSSGSATDGLFKNNAEALKRDEIDFCTSVMDLSPLHLSQTDLLLHSISRRFRDSLKRIYFTIHK